MRSEMIGLAVIGSVTGWLVSGLLYIWVML